MSGVLISIFTVVVAMATASFAVPAICRLAERWNFLDFPDEARHRHDRPVPRLGGVAVFAGLLVAVTLGSLLSPSLSEVTPWALPMNRALVLASGILFVIGLLDDLRGVSPALKLIGQSAAAGTVIWFGFRIEQVSIIPGYEFSLGILSVPVTLLWLVGVSNAYNLIDGVDGLAGSVGVLALVAIGASAVALGSAYVPLQSLALAGALLGFLKHNVPPARIFLGDSGSLVVGFLLAFLAVRGSTTPDGTVYALVPILALSYLLLDTGIAMMRRWLRGVPLSRADDRHIHHQLLALGLSPQRAVGVILLMSAFVAGLGLCVTFVPPAMTLAITALAVALLFAIFIYGIRWLEYHEFLEAGASFASGVRKARSSIQDRILARDVARIVKNAKTLEEVNAILRNYAPEFRFVHMEVLHENAPAAGTVRAPDHIGSPTWLLEYPLLPAPGENGLPRPGYADPVIAIWCSVFPNGRPVNAERVAQILCPTISDVLHAMDGSALDTAHDSRLRSRGPGSVMASKRRSSAEHRRIVDAAPPM